MLKNSNKTYGSIAKTFHWLIGLTVIGLLIAGFLMGGIDPSPLKFQVYNWHKSIGFLIFWLAALRLIWRFFNKQPDLLSSKKWERVLAHTVHVLLYVCLFLQPLSGWLMSSADTYPDPLVFGFDLPQIIEADQATKRLFSQIHFYTAWALVGFISMHFLGAMKHHFIDRDATLRRMLPFTKANK